MPQRTPLSSLKDNEFLKIESESKQLFPFHHAVAIHADKQLIELLRKHYFDRRAPDAVLDTVLAFIGIHSYPGSEFLKGFMFLLCYIKKGGHVIFLSKVSH